MSIPLDTAPAFPVGRKLGRSMAQEGLDERALEIDCCSSLPMGGLGILLAAVVLPRGGRGGVLPPIFISLVGAASSNGVSSLLGGDCARCHEGRRTVAAAAVMAAAAAAETAPF